MTTEDKVVEVAKSFLEKYWLETILALLSIIFLSAMVISMNSILKMRASLTDEEICTRQARQLTIKTLPAGCLQYISIPDGYLEIYYE